MFGVRGVYVELVVSLEHAANVTAENRIVNMYQPTGEVLALCYASVPT
jgi:hypothetical protein